jgi:hypothetical protein
MNLREYKSGRKKQGCVACGAQPNKQTPWRIGTVGNCKRCGASKGKQKGGVKSKATLAEDAALDAMLTQVVTARGAEIMEMPEPPKPEPISREYVKPKRSAKASDKLAKEAAWQAAHERKMAALRRLGLDVRAEVIPQGFHGSGEQTARDIAASEAKRRPMAELIDEARGGNAYAQWRANELYGETWQLKDEQRTG